MFITVLSFEPMSYSPLTPAPNCTESEYISECLRTDTRPTITDLATAGPIEIITDYRGSMLYCSGGVSVYRYSPRTFSGHGHVTLPSDGLEENVHIVTTFGNFDARIKFMKHRVAV